ncbi:hypothetical protein R3P38DRAFT_2824265 [Favolaschia claudopus]|uniref:PWI domain-containing protein n=1 Tax=Favolaschia claudopus TaxID=2862362 RepID=A0AAW0EG26_9AGAR
MNKSLPRSELLERKEEFESVHVAIEQIAQLDFLDPKTIAKDVTIHEAISVASNDILNFLDHVDQHASETSPQGLAVFGKLFNVEFFAVLFKQRKLFHGLATHSLPVAERESSAAVVCWVDMILSRLGDNIVVVASGGSLAPLLSVSTNFKGEDGLCAASQLPVAWLSVPATIASGQASPAAKRLALRLSFAAFVLGPCLSDKNEPLTPRDIIETLNCFINEAQATEFSDSGVGDQLALQERLNFSMVLSLYATASRDHASESHLRPRSLGRLLGMLQNVLHPDDTTVSLQYLAPPQILDSAQILLLHWGDAVAWCWKTWDDYRAANAESVVFLTTMWLSHLDIPILPEQVNRSMTVDTASSIAILRVLHQIILSLNTVPSPIDSSLTAMTIISRACLFSVQSMNYLLGRQNEDECWIVSNMCKCLLSLFVLLVAKTEQDLIVYDYIIEALSSVDPQTLHICVTHLLEDSALRFAVRLHERLVWAQNSILEPLQTLKLHLIRSTLNFAVVLWYSGAHGCLSHEFVSPLLRDITQCLTEKTHFSDLASVVLGDALLTAFSAERRDGPGLSDESRECLWTFGITSSPRQLSIASSFAHYVLTSNLLCDALYCAEAWQCLGNVLLLILKHHYIEEQEPLALLVCPTLCAALTRLLQANSASTRFILSTPFTLNLCADLTRVNEDTLDDKYFVLLKQRLEKVGLSLLDQIRYMLSPNAVAATLDVPTITMRLMFYRMYDVSHLVFVPDI